ncbi:MAG: hypothetical protein HYX51_00110 [Chloroflexi bacterium]|nr:hypothetical protein [Chloroflexota bacterium]
MHSNASTPPGRNTRPFSAKTDRAPQRQRRSRWRPHDARPGLKQPTPTTDYAAPPAHHTATERLREVGEVFASSQRAWVDLCERYTDEQLTFIIDFMTRGAAVLQEETEKLRRRTKAGEKRGRIEGGTGNE